MDIHTKSLDRPFTYRIPDSMRSDISVGTLITVPFGKGNIEKRGYVVSITDTTDISDDKVKEITSVVRNGISPKEKEYSLALFLKHHYGGTLSECLSVVLPEKVKVNPVKKRFLCLNTDEDTRKSLLIEAEEKKQYAKVRLFSAFSEMPRIPYSLVSERLSVSTKTVDGLISKGYLRMETEENKISSVDDLRYTKKIQLNEEQVAAVKNIQKDTRRGHILFGITGSGKTEVYLSLIEDILHKGQDVIVLIPEISLTYQTVMRFYSRFGDIVSVVHSKISKGEKCERFQKASEGSVRIMIGPRSALFTPFQNLGLIIIDEFHDGSYNSEKTPCYKSNEVALEIARRENAKVVFGSATPPVDYYYRALNGEFSLSVLNNRAVSGSVLPKTTIVDMREEMKKKNFSVFSGLLKEKIEDRLNKNEQVILFLNRRGYSGSVSCRECGEPIRCPHCSVALNFHKPSKMVCHICGYETKTVTECPNCHSKKIGTFGIGTQKVEEMVRNTFPKAIPLRMDRDTTSKKDGHKEILEKFFHREANVLIGTQMIVKGHDFPGVTLVGILAADLSLNVPDYRSSELTFQLLTQASGRAGRTENPGECIIQTYQPDQYAVLTSSNQDYVSFYEEEIKFRTALKYPPKGYMSEIIFSSAKEELLRNYVTGMAENLRKNFPGVRILGPSEGNPYKAKDRFYLIIYMKNENPEMLLGISEYVETKWNSDSGKQDMDIQYGGV